MLVIAKYRHGSADSTDKDFVYVVDEMPSLQEAKEFCSADKDEDRNIITVDKGIVTNCYKGSVDEINNSLLETYHYHEQTHELVIRYMMCRDVMRKIIRTVRIVISHLSRSQYRVEIKSALRGDWNKRMDVLGKIVLDEIDFDTLNKNMSAADIKKVIAFQVGQTLALLDGVEVYTKSGIANFYPKLKPYLQRYSDSNDDLQEMLNEFHRRISNHNSIVGYVGSPQVSYGLDLYDLINEVRIS